MPCNNFIRHERRNRFLKTKNQPHALITGQKGNKDFFMSSVYGERAAQLKSEHICYEAF